MPAGHRKKPFSAKLKKKQLQAKRDKKRESNPDDKHEKPDRVPSSSVDPADESSDSDEAGHSVDVKKINQQPSKSQAKYDPNRYRLHFGQEPREVMEERKRQAQQPQPPVPEVALEVDLDHVYKPGSVLDMPKRPAWNYHLSKAQLEAREAHYFKEYLDNIMEKYDPKELSYFELNLETWRQLWRVLEMSDVILLITDIRHPALHFSPTLYDYVTRELQKSIILVLNKIDLAPPALVVAWKHYFHSKFPQVHIVCFTSFPKDSGEKQLMNEDPGKIVHRKRRKGRFSAVGCRDLLKACEHIAQGKVDLSSWRDKIEVQIAAGDEPPEELDLETEVQDSSFSHHEEFRDGILTIGCVGYPNVGKSSLMNGLVGKKVVSTSRTPGHTKHFQTIFLTPTVKLCDSPGLVFPSVVEKPLQILAGIYPISQVREPYSAVAFLAQRIPLPQLLKLKHPEDEGMLPDPDSKRLWSGYDICDAWATKRGYITAKAARTDVYRAANSLLRLAVEGRLVLCMRPPGYTQHKDDWENHSETAEISQYLDMHTHDIKSDSSDGGELSSSEEEGMDPDKDRDEAAEENDSSEEKDGGASVSNPFALLGDE